MKIVALAMGCVAPITTSPAFKDAHLLAREPECTDQVLDKASTHMTGYSFRPTLQPRHRKQEPMRPICLLARDAVGTTAMIMVGFAAEPQ